MEKKKLIGGLIQLVSIALIISAVTIGNAIAYQFDDQISSLLCSPSFGGSVQTNGRAQGDALAAEIVEEGAVLLKNENNVLPLSNNKVNLFGRSSTDWIYSGSGSGTVRPTNDDWNSMIDLKKALTDYEINVNTDLYNFYTNDCAPWTHVSGFATHGTLSNDAPDFYRLYEPNLTSSIKSNAESFSNTAIVVIGRTGGESDDPTRVQYKGKYGSTYTVDSSRTYLEISTEEEELLTYVGANYENVVVLLNTTNVMELGFLDTIPGLDACLLVGTTGTSGAAALPKLLYGDASPSGRLADTYAYDLTSNISYNFSGYNGISFYTNSNSLGLFEPTRGKINSYYTTDGSSNNPGAGYADYVENIYVGYRWYETADEMNLWDDVSNKYGKGYEGVVQFPFGFGLSYTSFEWEISSLSIANGTTIDKESEFVFKVLVTNTGNLPGKDVVELYGTAPYTNGGIEKSSVVLLDYAKTHLLEPGMTEELTLTCSAEDLASYDCYDKNNNEYKGWELEKGNYKLSFRTDAHRVATIKAGTSVPSTLNYIVENDIFYETDSKTGYEMSNLFTGIDAIDGVPVDGIGTENINYISRANFSKTLEKSSARSMASSVAKNNTYAGHNRADKTKANAWDNASTDAFGNSINNKTVTWGSSGNLKIYNRGKPTELGLELGKDYDDSRWNQLLNQVTLNEAINVVSYGYTHTEAIDSIGKPRMTDYDGPAQIKSFSGAPRGTGYPGAFVIAQTWNKQLAKSFGLSYAIDMNDETISASGVYGFGVNLHRSPWQGRNYEYLSEDPYLAGTITAYQTIGLANGGKYGYLKHLALAQSETYRDGTYVWTTEQALREIYLKLFKIAIQEGEVTGIMSSYNRIGSMWTGGSEALIQGFIRNECGFKGAIITDYADFPAFMNQDHALRAGGDIGMNSALSSNWYSTSSSNRIQNQLKEAVKHIVYCNLHVQYVNSQYNASVDVDQQIISKVLPINEWWKPILLDIVIVTYTGCAIWAFFIVEGFVIDYLKNKKTNKQEDTNDEAI